jgi:cobalt/nickel transport system ATP-binding protein
MAASVSIKDFSFSYSSDSPVLRKINLEIKAGEKFGIIGPMGAGKSTLILNLNGILSGSGTMMIGDMPVTKKNLAEIRRKVGIVFQNPDDQLFNPTVEEDVAFGPLNFGFSKDEAAKMIDQAMTEMNLKGYEKSFSHHLSVGERKRVAIATVLALRPEVIAFDEPFANLDPGMITQLVDIINNIDSTLIIISQSFLPLASCCDRIAILNNGEIVATGKTMDILKNEKLLIANGIDLSLYKKICKQLFD